MYLLYADDSGVASDPNVKYSVLAGFETFENQNYWIQKAIDEIMLKYTGRADLELHASPLEVEEDFGVELQKKNVKEF